MSLAENILLMVTGIALTLLLLPIWLLFRKRKKLALGLSILLFIFYIGYYFYLVKNTENQSGVHDQESLVTEKNVLIIET